MKRLPETALVLVTLVWALVSTPAGAAPAGAAPAGASPAGASPAGASQAATAPAWSIVPSPPISSDNATLMGASCGSTEVCIAVGVEETATGEQPLAEQWNGVEWTSLTIQGVAKDSFLTSVSCAGAQWCAAVGSSISKRAVQRPLVEIWDASSWTIVHPPVPGRAGSTAGFDSVSCRSATSCTAVGAFARPGVNAQEKPLAEGWDGRFWSIQPTPNPKAENGSQLNGLSCSAADACTAGGNYAYADVDNSVFAVRWDGSTWTEQKQPNPAGQGFNVDSAVSCTGVDACTSVGSWTDGGDRSEPLAESWDGSIWSRQPVPHPDGNNGAGLNGLSCVQSVCIAVGDWSTSPGGSLPEYALAEHWDGFRWTVQVPPNPTGARLSQLDAVSCTSPRACVAVGSSWNGTVTQPLIESYRG